MGLIMRRNLMAAKSGYTAKDYVQDGLVAMWDGIENAGYAADGFEHDPNATVWKDLSGNGWDLTFPGLGSRPAAWEDVCATRVLSTRNSSNFAEGSVAAPEIHVVEAVFQRAYYSNLTYPKTVFQGRQGCAVRIFEAADNEHDCVVFGGYSTNVGIQIGNLNGIVSVALIMSGAGNSTIVTDFFLNGVRVPDSELVSVTGGWNANSPYPLIIGGRRVSSNDQAFSGRIYRVNCYSSLSAKDVAANYAIDKARFNLT